MRDIKVESLKSENEKLQIALLKNDLRSVVDIYTKKAKMDLKMGNKNNAYFNFTQAYIFALEGGLRVSDEIYKILLNGKREV